MSYDENRMSDMIDAGLSMREEMEKHISELEVEIESFKQRNLFLENLMEKKQKKLDEVQGKIDFIYNQDTTTEKTKLWISKLFKE